ncbi:MAG: biotin/lipoyl-containing protein [Candidatus Lustribacter sp.]|jgi:acetyl-CoA carboxylase biotin carboxyl carrier protein
MSDDDAGRVRALAAILREYDLDAVRVQVGETEYELVRREPAPAAASIVVPGPGSAPAAAPGGEPAAVSGAAASPNVKRVTAPVVGVFYGAPAPGADPFVSVGDRVVPGQVLCILEAMKLMNEITSEFAGVVSRVIPENGQLVSLGDDLFWIEP